jgi:hypothetical protein
MFQMECPIGCGEKLESEEKSGILKVYDRHVASNHQASPAQWTEAHKRIEAAKERVKQSSKKESAAESTSSRWRTLGRSGSAMAHHNIRRRNDDHAFVAAFGFESLAENRASVSDSSSEGASGWGAAVTSPFTRFICTICGIKAEPCEHWVEQETVRVLRRISETLEAILDDRKFVRHELLEIIHELHVIRAKLIYPTGMSIIGLKESDMSTPAGGTSVFLETPTPAGSVFPTGTTFTWTVDDTADITLKPSADGTGVTAACVPAPTGTSYNLTCTSSYTPPGAPTPISASLNVPIIAGVVAPTGMTISQTS